MAKKIEVEIVGDASSLHKALGKASDSGSSFARSMGHVAKGAAFAAGAAGLGGLFLTLKTGFGEWKQHTLVAAQTAAVLKSTGGAAKVTKKEVEGLAGALMKKTGIDDEVIQS